MSQGHARTLANTHAHKIIAQAGATRVSTLGPPPSPRHRSGISPRGRRPRAHVLPTSQSVQFLLIGASRTMLEASPPCAIRECYWSKHRGPASHARTKGCPTASSSRGCAEEGVLDQLTGSLALLCTCLVRPRIGMSSRMQGLRKHVISTRLDSARLDSQCTTQPHWSYIHPAMKRTRPPAPSFRPMASCSAGRDALNNQPFASRYGYTGHRFGTRKS